jgi:hypothetical protein
VRQIELAGKDSMTISWMSKLRPMARGAHAIGFDFVIWFVSEDLLRRSRCVFSYSPWYQRSGPAAAATEKARRAGPLSGSTIRIAQLLSAIQVVDPLGGYGPPMSLRVIKSACGMARRSFSRKLFRFRNAGSNGD